MLTDTPQHAGLFLRYRVTLRRTSFCGKIKLSYELIGI